MAEEKTVKEEIKEQFDQLPKVVQQAITSADVQKNLRALSDTHKLHLDQWEILETEVMLTLLGIETTDDLQKNIKSEVGVSDEIAAALAADISKVVFEPIRQELERQLEHPDAQAAVIPDMDAARTATLAGEQAATAADTASPNVPALGGAAAASVFPAPGVTAPSAVLPATPPPAPSTDKATRAPISEAYKAGEPSSVRSSVHDDPYREPPA